MEIYDSLLGAVCDEYDRVTLIKKSERGEVTLIRHRASGNRYIFRHFSGSSEVYRKLLTVSCPNLPQIMEVGEKEGKTALLEEYVQGDTLGEILQGGLLASLTGEHGDPAKSQSLTSVSSYLDRNLISSSTDTSCFNFKLRHYVVHCLLKYFNCWLARFFLHSGVCSVKNFLCKTFLTV